MASALFAEAARAEADADAPPPAISSDKADYAPGEVVTLSGSNWAPGEHVHIRVDDAEGQTWSRGVDVVADAAGNITDQFSLPEWFVAVYSVTATGPLSGTASTSFSDATLVFALATAGNSAPANVTWSVNWDQWQGQGNNPNLMCSGTRTSFGTAAYNGNTLTSGSGTQPGINQNASAKPTAAQTTGTFAGIYVFDYWSSSASSTTPLTNPCQAGVNGPTVFTLFAHFKLADSTAPATTATASKETSPATAYAFGDWSNADVTVTLSAADNAGGSGVKEIRYTLSGSDPSATSGSVYAGPFVVSAEGATTLKFRAFDNAGNAESTQTKMIGVDKTAPAIARNTAGDSCSAGGSNGWCRGMQIAAFTAMDSGSGLPASQPSSFTQSTTSEGTAVQIASGTVEDVAGNVNPGIAAGPFKLDSTAPSITVGLARPADHDGWYNAPVGYSISATSDDLSGVDEAGCDGPATYGGPDGDPVSVSRSCLDNAGNSGSGSASFKYDAAAPSSQASSPQFNNGPTIPVDYSSPDAASELSGLDSIELWVKGPTDSAFHQSANAPATSASGSFAYEVDQGEGSYSFYTVAIDGAGNHEAVPADSSPRVMTTLQDETAPVTTDDAPGGWHNGPVTVTLTATDGGSGVEETFVALDDSAYAAGTSVVVAAPADHSNDGTHVVRYYSVDRATNSETVRTATVRIDTVAPALTDLGPSPASPDGQNGWYVHPVTNRFQAADSGSGLDADCAEAFPANAFDHNVKAVSTGSREGSALTVTAGPCSDAAGNAAAPVESSPFQIDLSAPSISFASRLPAANGHGWNSSAVTVTWECADGISGPKTAQASDRKSGEGADQTAHGTCEDLAGNSASASLAGISIDETKPVVSGSRAPAANGYGWNNTDVVVDFSCSDAGPVQSGIAVDTVAGTTLGGEGANQSVTNGGECFDKADNVADAATVAGVFIDKSDPTITFVSRIPAANGFGWNNEPVTVAWSCADQAALSGVVAAEVVDVVAEESADQSAGGVCEDRAGNTSAASHDGISIDKTKPSVAILAPMNGQSYKWNVAVAADYACFDELSGPAACSGDIPDGAGFVALPAGLKSFSVDASDRAGNTATATSSYTVVYDFQGLFQPIDMGAGVLNSVRAGSAIPVKFKLGGDAGMDVFRAGSPSSIGITCSASAVIDALEETLTASTSGLQYDPAADQYVYVWKTVSTWANSCRQLRVILADGRIVSANFKFR